MESRDMVGRLESTFPCHFKGRQVFTYHGGRLLSQSISFYKHHTRYHVNGFGGCWWGLHFMQGKYRYGCVPVWRFCTVSSRQIHPSDGRLSFLPKPLPSVLTLIHYKKVQTISQRSPVQWKVETRLVVSSWGFPCLFKEGRHSLTTTADCCHSTWIVYNHFYFVGLEYLYRSDTIEEVSVRDKPMAPSRSQHFNTELTSWNEDTHRQLQQHSPGDNSKRRVNMLAYMRHIMSQESWDVLLRSSATKTRQ
jgi:hypothetical protein